MDNIVYDDNDFLSTSTQLKKYRILAYTVLGIYLAISTVIFIIYRGLPYKDVKIGKLKTVQYFITGVFAIFMYLFYNLKIKPVKAYHKILGYISTGLKENNYGEFVRFEDVNELKDGVEFKLMIMSEWYAKKQEYYERKVLIDREKSFPSIQPGQKINYVTQGNILLEYSLTKEEG